jgi:hypothetical protein
LQAIGMFVHCRQRSLDRSLIDYGGLLPPHWPRLSCSTVTAFKISVRAAATGALATTWRNTVISAAASLK